MMHPEEAQRLIHEGVKRGVETRRELKPYKIAHPVRLEIHCKRTVDCELMSYLPQVERTQGNVIVFTARDMIEASKFLEAVTSLNTFSD